ncbi:MAG: chemotaxis protein CheW [Gammaproteobacteria bacterium]|nr:chemotaxis protein CheW [Gammaproteobacteria bacterium]MCP5136221.1 chemotaxis protein CheW [Gammaproteobacteria bacterium]
MSPGEDLSRIRAFLVPLGEFQMLLPNATVAEVVDYHVPRPVEGAPAWMLGIYNWRGRDLPLYSQEHAMGQRAPAPDRRARILIINGLTQARGAAQYGIVTRGIPHLVMVDRNNIEAREQMLKSPVVRAFARLDDANVLIPDLDRVEAMLAGVMANVSASA